MEAGFSSNESPNVGPPADETTINKTVKLRRSNRLIEKRQLALGECRTINLLDDDNDIGIVEPIDFPQVDLNEFDRQFGENPANEESNPSMNNLLASNSNLDLDKSIACEYGNENIGQQFDSLMPEPIDIKKEPKDLYFGDNLRNLSLEEVQNIDEKMKCLSTSKCPCSDLNVPTFPQAAIIQDPPPLRLNLNPNDANNLVGSPINQQSTSRVQGQCRAEEPIKTQTAPIAKQTKSKIKKTGRRKKRNSRKKVRRSDRVKKLVAKRRNSSRNIRKTAAEVRKDLFESSDCLSQLKHLIDYKLTERSSKARYDWEVEPKQTSWHSMTKMLKTGLNDGLSPFYSKRNDLNDYLDRQCVYCECEILKTVGEGNVNNIKRKRLN